MAEQLIRNEQVAGSIPVTSSNACVNNVFPQAFSFLKNKFHISIRNKKSHPFLRSEFCDFWC